MKPEGSLPCSQDPSSGPYPEPDQSSLYPISVRTIRECYTARWPTFGRSVFTWNWLLLAINTSDHQDQWVAIEVLTFAKKKKKISIASSVHILQSPVGINNFSSV
jgi:hypothetical protein